MARHDIPLPEQITEALREVTLARCDGGAAWITKATRMLDQLLDQMPRSTPQPKEIECKPSPLA